MKKGPAKSRRKRILLFYSLVMLIPGLALGYMAYRGILNDQALREKQARSKMVTISQEFFGRFDSLLQYQFDRYLDPAYNFDDPEVLLLFKQEDERKKILQHKLIYLPSEELKTAESEISERAIWEKGWNLEFGSQDLDAALDYFTRLEDSLEIPEDKLKTLTAQARIMMKLGRPEAAGEKYQNIIDSYPALKIKGGIPAKAMALAELSEIRYKNKSPDLKESTSQLISFLIRPEAEYNKAVFRYFSKTALGYNIPGIPDSLISQLKKKEVLTDQLLQWYSGFSLFTGQLSAEDNPVRRFISGDELSAIFIIDKIDSQVDYGLIMDLDLWVAKKKNELFSSLNEQKDINWKIVNNLAPESLWSNQSLEIQDWVSYNFPTFLPQWSLQMAPKTMGWFAMIFQPGNGVFMLIFIFIILIMLLGLGFTIHILNQELRLNKLKTEFISNVSHELKSPLTSIRQMTEMLNDQRIDSEEQRNDYYSIMLDQSEHLSHLIDNILDFSRMEEDRKLYHFEELDLVPVIEKLIVNFRQQTKEQGFIIDFDKDVKKALVRADKDALKQVVYNLIDNAIKFSGGSKRLSCRLHVAGSKDKKLGLSVRDWGIGIHKKEQEKIFERFYRSPENLKLGIKGSGIGLTLVKRIIEAHDGSIDLISKPGLGTTISVYLPLVKSKVDEEDTVNRG